MGKSVDLPDPLESVASQPLGNADDLLAQLAGEEVDRLLAEADAEGTQQAKSGEGRRTTDMPADLGDAMTALPSPAPSPAPSAAIQDQLDALFSEVTAEQLNPAPSAGEPTPVAPPAPFAAPAASEPVAPIAPAPFSPVTSKLPDDIDADEVMAAILGDGMSTAAVPVTPSPVEEQSIVRTTPPVAAPTAIVSARTAEIETSVAERQGLAAPDPDASSPDAPADALPGPGELALLSAPVEDDVPLPAYLKPLEWMNAPLDMLPTPIRDVLGQVAILTLVNAIAVLIYVFVFRRS